MPQLHQLRKNGSGWFMDLYSPAKHATRRLEFLAKISNLYSMQCWDRNPKFDDVSNGDLQRVYLLAWSNPWAFLRMGACQVNRQSERLFSRRLACQIADTRAHTLTHILSAARGHIPNQVHTRIYTHIAVYWFDMAHRLWWQYQVLVWLRWWRQRQDGGCHLLWVTGRRGKWGGGGVREVEWQLSSWHAVYPSVELCFCLP